MNAPKSVFQTTTGKSSLVVILSGLITIITPHACDYLERHSKLDDRDIQTGRELTLEIVKFLVLGGGYASLVGRASATLAYSPAYMSGLNKKEIERQKQLTESTDSQDDS